jgi:hypothetical protein
LRSEHAKHEALHNNTSSSRGAKWDAAAVPAAVDDAEGLARNDRERADLAELLQYLQHQSPGVFEGSSSSSSTGASTNSGISDSATAVDATQSAGVPESSSELVEPAVDHQPVEQQMQPKVAQQVQQQLQRIDVDIQDVCSPFEVLMFYMMLLVVAEIGCCAVLLYAVWSVWAWVYVTSHSFFRCVKLDADDEHAAAALNQFDRHAAAAAGGEGQGRQLAQQQERYASAVYKWVQQQLQPGLMTLEGVLLAAVTASLARIALFTDAESLNELAAQLDHDAADTLGPIANSLLLWITSGSWYDLAARLVLDGACVLSTAAAMRICAVAVAAFPGQPVRQWLEGSRGLLLGSVLPVLAVLLAFAMPFALLQSLVAPLVPAALLLQLPLNLSSDGGRLRIWRAANGLVAAVFSPVVAGMCLVKLLRLEPADDTATDAAAAADVNGGAVLFHGAVLDLHPGHVAQQAELILVLLLALAHMVLALVEHCRCLVVMQLALNASKHVMASGNSAAAVGDDGDNVAGGAAAVIQPVAPAALQHRHSFWYVLKLTTWLVLGAFIAPTAAVALLAYWSGCVNNIWPPWAWELLGVAVAGVGASAVINCPAMLSGAITQRFMAACGASAAAGGGAGGIDDAEPLHTYVKAVLFGEQRLLPDCSGWYVVIGVDGHPALVHLKGVPASLLQHHQQQQQQQEQVGDEQQQQQQQRIGQELQQQVALAWLYAGRHAAFTRPAVVKCVLAVCAGMLLVVKQGGAVALASAVRLFVQAAGDVARCIVSGSV